MSVKWQARADGEWDRSLDQLVAQRRLAQQLDRQHVRFGRHNRALAEAEVVVRLAPLRVRLVRLVEPLGGAGARHQRERAVSALQVLARRPRRAVVEEEGDLRVAVDETVILLRPPLPLVGVWRQRQQNDRLLNVYLRGRALRAGRRVAGWCSGCRCCRCRACSLQQQQPHEQPSREDLRAHLRRRQSSGANAWSQLPGARNLLPWCGVAATRCTRHLLHGPAPLLQLCASAAGCVV